ncbi:hypothetical protein [Streptomyces sp. NPDC007100]|uniref:hypothetical protein n=1 Tax=Streptomyces sp. NPDC007100 TaxID=3155602 RepID=UPI0033D503F8
MSADPIDPSGIPRFTGNLDQLEKDAAALKKNAADIRHRGSDIHTGFQGLRSFYRAPEADQLFSTTKPVADKADAFADDLEQAAAALDGYAAEVRPLVAKLDRLRGQAAAFVADDVKTDEDWQYDEDKVAKNNDLWQDVKTTTIAFWDAERATASKISALVGGARWVPDDGSHKPHSYRFSAEDMDKAGEMPWGKVVEEKLHWYEPARWGHWAKAYLWDGLVMDGAVGTVDGLWTMLGGHGGEKAGAAWKTLFNGVSGLGQYMVWPVDWLCSTTLGGGNPDNEQKAAFREILKGFVAWDQWGENKARAAGAASFNVFTTIATIGAGGAVRAGTGAAGKAGKAGEVLGAIGKLGRAIDPVTQGTRAAGAAIKATKIDQAIHAAFQGTKASKALDNLRNALTAKATATPSGSLHLPDGHTARLHGPLPDLPPGKTAVELPHGADNVPKHSVKYGDNEFLTPEGKVVDRHGTTLKGSHPLSEPSAADRALLDKPSQASDSSRSVPADHELATTGALPHAKGDSVLHADGRLQGDAGAAGNAARGGSHAVASAGGGGHHMPEQSGGRAAGGHGDGGNAAHPEPNKGLSSHDDGAGHHTSPATSGTGDASTALPSEGGHLGDGGTASHPGTEIGSPDDVPHQAAETPARPPEGEPIREMTPPERAQHQQRLEELERRYTEDFKHLEHDPDHRNTISRNSQDEARVGLDMREQGRLPADIRRPDLADQGDLYSETTGRQYDIKAIHSEWPPHNNQRDKSKPFKGAYNPAKNGEWVAKLRTLIEVRGRVGIIDTRNANQAAIDDVRKMVEIHGWEDDVIWYP